MSASMNCTPWNSEMDFFELLAFLRVGDAGVERALRQSDGLGADGRTIEIERAHRRPKTLAFFADKVLDGDPDIVEENRRIGRTAKTHLSLMTSEGDALH